jgi:hypothetical protein
MGDSSKTTLVSAIVAAACIILYIAVLGYGAVIIIKDIGERRVLAEQEFSDLADRSASAVILGFMSQAYQEVINDTIDDSRTLRAAIISGSDGEYGFERQPGTAINWVGDSPRFITGFGISGEPYYQPLRIDSQRNTTIQAIYTYIDYDLFLKTLKNTLILVLAALALAVFTLMIEIVMKNRDTYYKAPSARSAAVPPVSVEPAGPAAEVAVAAVAAEKTVQEEDGDLFDIDIGNDINNDNDIDEKIPAGEEAPGKPQGLYSPRSNVGWESYTKDRLDSELHRCAASEQDLTFIMADYNGEKAGDVMYKAFTAEAAVFFTLKDLIFEKGSQGISVIIPGIDVDLGLEKTKEFHRRILKKLPEYFTKPSDLCIGFSARSGRLVETDRIMLEASSALEKAKQDPSSPVVGFKSDPEKYREFISKKHEQG